MDNHDHIPSPVSEPNGSPTPRKQDESETTPIGTSTSVDLPTGVVSRNSKSDSSSIQLTSEPEESSLSTTPSEPHATWQETAQSLTDQALQFLSTASNETIGACLVGLSATTYVVLGRVGLVIIGVVGGVVLHATWEGSHNTSVAQARADEERRRKEIGLDVVKRALAWRTEVQEKYGEPDTRIELVGEKKQLDFSSLPPESGAALSELTNAAVRDYIKWWYSPLIPGEIAFPSMVQQTSTAFMLSISNHLARKRPADAFLDFLTHASSIVIVFLNELAIAVNSFPNVSTQEAIQLYLQNKPESNLSYLINTEQQQKKLDLIAEDILQTYLEHKSYNCEPVRVFLREVLSKVILDMTVQLCSRAEFINEWIVYLLDENYVPLTKPDTSESSDIVKDVDISPVADTVSSPEQIRHRRVVSKAQEAMDEAMREAARLTQMIAEDDARKQRQQETQQNPLVEEESKADSVKKMSPSVTSTDDASESTRQGMHTPTSSQSDNLQTSPPLSQTEAESVPPDPESNRDSTEERKAPTSFDQIVPQEKPTALLDEEEQRKREAPPLTLHKATIVILDDSDPADRASIRSKPTTEYLVQVEPATTQYPGWMIVRRLSDFDSLHQILFRIARVSDAKKFAEAHLNLPNWKGMTKAKYREELERYLNDAMQHRSLADSEGMKRFLEKDQYMSRVPNKQAFPGLGAIENVGKGVIDAIGQAPKGVASGGKAIIGGVGSVIGAAGRVTTKKNSVSSVPAMNRSNTSISSSTQPKGLETSPKIGVSAAARMSHDSLGNLSPIVDTQPAPVPQMERRPSHKPEDVSEMKPQQSYTWPHDAATPILGGDQFITLPPPPAVISDDYELPKDISGRNLSSRGSDDTPGLALFTASSSVDSFKPAPDSPLASKKPRTGKAPPPLSEQEAQVAVELGLAAITELYKLSSAWSVRLAFLSAAKSILLRPGNAQLDSLRQLMQTTVLDTHFSDVGIANLIRKTRENSLPTQEEMDEWPPERTAEERETLRRQARKVLLEKGMPQALNSVMGQAASAESLGKVFDALQVAKVARGLVFGLMLQALRAVTH